MHLQESGEMYLETILILSKTGKNVRSVDVSEYMGDGLGRRRRDRHPRRLPYGACD